MKLILIINQLNSPIRSIRVFKILKFYMLCNIKYRFVQMDSIFHFKVSIFLKPGYEGLAGHPL